MGKALLNPAGQGRASVFLSASHRSLSQVLHCQLSAEEVRFPISVTQQSPAAVSMETYHVTLTLPPTQVEGNVGQGMVEAGSAFSLWFLSGMEFGQEGCCEEWGRWFYSFCSCL